MLFGLLTISILLTLLVVISNLSNAATISLPLSTTLASLTATMMNDGDDDNNNDDNDDDDALTLVALLLHTIQSGHVDQHILFVHHI